MEADAIDKPSPLETLKRALDQGTARQVHRLVNSMHPAEVASLLEFHDDNDDDDEVETGPEPRDDVFVPFQRLGDTDNSTGLGLGLALSKGFVEGMGGTLEADDTPGGGLTMVISLPAVGDQVQSSTTDKPDPSGDGATS